MTRTFLDENSFNGEKEILKNKNPQASAWGLGLSVLYVQECFYFVFYKQVSYEE